MDRSDSVRAVCVDGGGLQRPGADWIRRAVIEVDALFGSPVWSVLNPRGN
jgi:hypothetical protein